MRLQRALNACALVLVLAFARHAHAQDLLVLEASEQDHLAADKLQELSKEPFARLSADALRGRDLSRGLGCTTGARFELVLDSMHDAVRLVRCRDATVLTREIDPQAALETPYLGAFIAAELLALNAELERVAPPPMAAAKPALPLRSERRRDVQLRLRLGFEAILAGAPFGGAIRPNLGLGVATESGWRALAWLLEVHVAAFGAGGATQGDGRIELTRNDGQLRVGMLYADGRLSLAGWLFGRGSVTNAEYTAATRFASAQLRWGLGVGAEAECLLQDWAFLYASLSVDVATSRSDYRVNGLSWARDPAVVWTTSVGFLLRGRL